MDKAYVSIIVPVYNGESYLARSLETVLSQTYPYIELIAVDDGSRDNSYHVLEHIKERIPSSYFMQIISQENKGICAARNIGLDAANGAYIAFMDHDDFLKADYIETMVKLAEETQADMVIGSCELVDANRHILQKWTLDETLLWSKYRVTSPWGKLFRRSFIETNHLRYMNTNITEGFYFHFLCLSYAQTVVVTSKGGYQWLMNQASESHANRCHYSSERNLLNMLTELQHNMRVPNHMEPSYVAYAMTKHIIWYLLYVAKSMSKKELNTVYQECMDWLKQYYPDYDKNKLLHIGALKGEAKKTRLTVLVLMSLKKIGLLRAFLQLYRVIGLQ